MEYFKGVLVKDLEIRWADVKSVEPNCYLPEGSFERRYWPVDWQSLPCCGGTCTRGICAFHNCPPEEK